MKAKCWVIGWLVSVGIILVIIGSFVYKIDPYFHYHKPNTSVYYYDLDNQRSQNDGISKHFDYNALITGTSMTENFKASEADEFFGVNSIKVPYAGGHYKEMNENLKIALKYNSNLKLIIRGLDTGFFFSTADSMRLDLGTYPTYLYDDNPFNDVMYLFNKDVIFGRAYTMAQANDEEGFKAGITSFDQYSRWQESCTFGIKTVAPDGVTFNGKADAVHLSDKDKDIIYENITQNVTSLADKYPDVDFYYFFTPYSILWYKDLVENGTIYRQLEAEEYVIELILQHENIKLFSFNGNENIITDINNYKDPPHYATWINSYMLRCMSENEHRLTAANYHAYIDDEYNLLLDYDYDSLNGQEDYVNDLYSAALMNESIWGVKPIDVLKEYADSIELLNAEIVTDQFDSGSGIRCIGSLQREPESDVTVTDYIQNNEYIGAKVTIDSIGKHNYLVFYGKKVVDHAQPTVIVFDSNNNKVGKIAASYHDLDAEWHQFIIDLSDVEGDITVYLNGGYIDNTGSLESEYIFSNIILY